MSSTTPTMNCLRAASSCMPGTGSGFCIDLTEDTTRESRWTGVSSIPFIIVTKKGESDSSDAMPQSYLMLESLLIL